MEQGSDTAPREQGSDTAPQEQGSDTPPREKGTPGESQAEFELTPIAE